MTVPPFTTSLRRLGAGVAFGLTLLASVFAAEKKRFDIPAGTADQALRQFTVQSGAEVVYPTEIVRGVKTPAVRGELTPAEAIDRLLAESALVVKQDEQGTTFMIARDPNGPRAAGERSSVRPEENREKGPLVLEKYQVNARIDGLNNRGLLQAGENAPLYHDVVSRVDIERLGISSLEELFRYIPQTSSPTTSLQEPQGNSFTSGGLTPRFSTVGLRGFSSAQTVILVNGRALPRSGLGENGGADIGRIPIAAIERVEILPYAGSAIYGAGAIGGAINIILRKEFTGRDLTTYVGTSTEGGATEFRFTYLDGRTFNNGRTNLTLTLSYQHREGLRANERGYLDEALRRYGPDSTVRNAQGVTIFEQYILAAFAGSPGTIRIGNDPSGAAPTELGIPGAPGARFAAIPLGTSPAASLTLTPASFTATAGDANLSPRYGRSILYEPIDAYSLNAQLEHEFVKDKLEAFGEFTLGYNRKEYDFPQQVIFDLDANDPLNPFRTNVTPGFVGRPVTVFLDTPDIPDPSALYEYESARAVVGLKGQLTETWEWSVDGAIDYNRTTVDSHSPPDNLVYLQRLALSPSVFPPGPAAPVEVRRAIYPLLADHRAFPLSEADSRRYFDSVRHSAAHGTQVEGNFRVLGEVMDLPAGPLRASALAKHQRWDFVGGDYRTGSADWAQLIFNGAFPAEPGDYDGKRSVWQGAVEVSVPVISERWRPLPVDALDLQASFSREEDDTSGFDANDEPFSNKQRANSAVVAARLQVVRDVAFRASYSEGFYPPNWGDVSLPTSTFSLPGFFPDPKRGNTLQFTPNMTIMQGGNPNLKPETAKSHTLGVILTPRVLPKLSFNVDYWRIKKTDAVVSRSFVDIIANPDAFGFLITRQAPDASDPQGWLGRITAVDARAFNASVTDTEGVDLRLRYTLDTDAIGSFDFTGGASFTNHFYLAATPTAPVIDTAGGSGPLRWRGNASLTWYRGFWSTTVTGRYLGHHSTFTTDPSPSFPGAFPLDGGRLPAILHWDLQLSYEIPYREGATRDWRNWAAGTKWTVGALNVLNDAPTFVTNGTGFYDSYDDPRQRYVYVQVRKSF